MKRGQKIVKDGERDGMTATLQRVLIVIPSTLQIPT